jgi:hypothetical protein
MIDKRGYILGAQLILESTPGPDYMIIFLLFNEDFVTSLQCRSNKNPTILHQFLLGTSSSAFRNNPSARTVHLSAVRHGHGDRDFCGVFHA